MNQFEGHSPNFDRLLAAANSSGSSLLDRYGSRRRFTFDHSQRRPVARFGKEARAALL